MMIRMTLLALLLASSNACAKDACNGSVKETYHIPQGFSGPVVVVFEQPNAEMLKPSLSCEWNFQIPANGTLFVSNQAPESGIYYRHFLIAQNAEGQVETLGRDLTETQFQVFGYIVGGTGMLDGQSTGDVKWIAFLVGVPADTRNSSDVLHEAIHRAVRLAVSQRSIKDVQ